MAEIVHNVRPAWYVLQIVPAHERIAAGHLVARRFGVFCPEVEGVKLVRGKRRKALNPMFPGYIFVFLWFAPRNYHRVRSCPGVWDFLCIDGRPAQIPDGAINAVRACENKQRPLTMTQEGIGTFKKLKRRWRRERTMSEQVIADSEIVSVHTWSALRDSLDEAVDSDKRTQVLLNALSLSYEPRSTLEGKRHA
jgi:transcription antitermination factor NusG